MHIPQIPKKKRVSPFLKTYESNYYSHENVSTILKQKGSFHILSLNIQSIHAKFNNLSIFINGLLQQKFEFSAICLQETWLSSEADLSLLQLENYNCIHQGKHSSEHGGLIIYLHKKYDYQIINDNKYSNIWECLSVKIGNPNNGKDLKLLNVYKPPKENNNSNINQFIDELSTTISQINNSKENVIVSFDYFRSI